MDSDSTETRPRGLSGRMHGRGAAANVRVRTNHTENREERHLEFDASDRACLRDPDCWPDTHDLRSAVAGWHDSCSLFQVTVPIYGPVCS